MELMAVAHAFTIFLGYCLRPSMCSTPQQAATLPLANFPSGYSSIPFVNLGCAARLQLFGRLPIHSPTA